jgi:ankyrin repeat protein
MSACGSAALDAVAARLVAAGAQLDLIDDDGDSALVSACVSGRGSTALLLVEAGAAVSEAAIDFAEGAGLAEAAAAMRARLGDNEAR